MKKFFEHLPWQTVFAVCLGIFFLRNVLMPTVADDYSYAFIWDGDGRGNLLDGLDGSRLQPIESFGDIIQSQWSHYLTWGGRTIAHIFVQLFMWKGHLLFDAANTLVFAAMVLLLFKAGTGLPLRELNKTYLLFIFAGLHFCTPSSIISTFWLTGACNYLWMSTLIILFLLPFAAAYRQKNFWSEASTGTAILMAILGLCAGWSIEPGAAVAVSLTSLFVLDAWLKKNLQPWMKVGFAFLIVGAAILFLSPGNFHRLELTNALEPDELVPPDEQWTLQMFLTNFVIGFLPDFARELILFVPIIWYFARAQRSEAVSRFILMFAGAAVMVLSIMMFSPEFPERAGFPSTIFLLVASLAALKEILPDVKNFCRHHVKGATLAAGIFAAWWTVNLLGCIYVEYDVHRQFAARDAYIAAHKHENLIKVAPLKIPSWTGDILGSRTWDALTFELGGELDDVPDGCRSVTFARYHGLKKIVVAKDSP